jgi:hypothetical protein
MTGIRHHRGWMWGVLIFLAGAVLLFFFSVAGAETPIDVKTPSLQMELEKVEMGPVPLDYKIEKDEKRDNEER